MAHANSPIEKKAPYIRIQSKWFKNNCQSGAKIGFDPRMHRVAWKQSIEKQ